MKKSKSSRSAKMFSIVIMVSVVVLFSACNQQKSGNSNNEVEIVEEGESIDYGKKMLIDQMDDAINLADEYIQKMKSKLDAASQSERIEIESTIEAIEDEKQSIATQRDEVRQASVDTWQMVKNDVEKSVNLSRHTIDSLVKHTEKP